MHRKRVTCEMHDSYFRSMKIKHAIPKTAEVTHSDGQLWGDIEWAIELLYNSVKTGCQLVWRPEGVGDKMWQRKPSSSGELGPRASGWATQENGKETLMAMRVGRSINFSSLRSPTPSHTQPFQINWEVYFSKWLCRSSLLMSRYKSACKHLHMSIQHIEDLVLRVIKVYFTHPKFPELEPHHQILFSVMPRIPFWLEILYLYREWSRCIFHASPTW